MTAACNSEYFRSTFSCRLQVPSDCDWVPVLLEQPLSARDLHRSAVAPTKEWHSKQHGNLAGRAQLLARYRFLQGIGSSIYFLSCFCGSRGTEGPFFTAQTSLLVQFFQVSHHRQYPPYTSTVFSYFESRGGKFPEVCFFGLQYILKVGTLSL